MRKWTVKIAIGIILTLGCLPYPLNAQNNMNTDQSLTAKQQGIIPIAAYTATGQMQELKSALNDGLEAGLTISEIKEVIVHLYAYTGFPRSLNALNSFMDVLDERKQKGIKDNPGMEPTPLPANKTMLQLGTENQTRLVGQPVKGKVYEFAPAIDQFLKEHLFGAIFGRDNLDFKTREIVTISALSALGGVENQLRSHLNVGMYNGLTEAQLKHLVSIVQTSVGDQKGEAANKVLQAVLTQKQGTGVTENTTSKDSQATHDKQYSSARDILFPKGSKATNQNFTGTTWVNIMVTDSIFNTSMGNVTFEPGARTKWHSHPGGQLLLVTNGVGYYQEKGKPAQLLKKGDVVKILPNIVHWHGASADSALTHVAISTNLQKGSVVWLEPVTDEEYQNVK